MNIKKIRSILLIGTTLGATALLPSIAMAQEASDEGGLAEIVVTAQKREQSVQDVPIAVSALGAETLQANRVVSVTDLGGLAPGVSVRTSAGGSQLPSFSVRGAVSYGVVPGSDRQVSMYIDGVYVASPRGSIFDLPDLERIEILRGPQGTLFGRNATAGAVSISTREPDGNLGVTVTGSVGNRDAYRFRTTISSPQMGPFSAYVSYVHDQKHGDIRNLDAGQVWDRTAAAIKSVAKVQRSVPWLGSKNSDSYFAALKFESGGFKTVYKYDRTDGTGSAEATVLTTYLPSNIVIPGIEPFVRELFASQANPVEVVTSVRRPKTARNGWVVPYVQKVSGHSLTSTYEISDSISLKNIFAYRKSFIYNTSALTGYDGLKVTASAAPLYGLPNSYVGAPFAALGIQVSSRTKQVSDELQLNYNSSFLTATIGGMWFKSKDYTNEHLLQNTVFLTPFLNGVIPSSGIGYTKNTARSLAAYAQLEFHLTPQIDLIAGGRITKDKKTDTLIYGTSPASLNTLIGTPYRKTKPSYLIGVNYKPNNDILIYGKYSTAFVAGGSVGGVGFAPETAKSLEAGIKADLFDRRLRTSLSVYSASYKNYQAAQGANNYAAYVTQVTGDPDRWRILGTIVVAAGGVKAKGFEFDFTAAPATGLTVGGSLSYSKVTYNNINPVILAVNGGRYLPSSFRPKNTGSLWAQYETKPLFGDAYMTFRLDGLYQSYMGLAQNPGLPVYVANPNEIGVPAHVIVNGRVALRDIKLGGVTAEVAAWGKNLTDRDYAMFPGDYTQYSGASGTIFMPARSYGLDVTVKF